jgi:hypothetical protein
LNLNYLGSLADNS